MLFIFVSILLGPILLAVGWLVAPRSPSEQKLSPYECGFSPLEGQTRRPLRVSFYLVGILFLLFDLELLVTFPFVASNGPFSSPLRFWVLFWFIGLLTGGFVFEIRLGVLFRSGRQYLGRFIFGAILGVYLRFLVFWGDISEFVLPMVWSWKKL